jgi:imidazolonepropionase-like amidohydrolase
MLSLSLLLGFAPVQPLPAAPAPVPRQTTESPGPAPIAITQVTVIQGGSPDRSNQTVIIRGNRILAVGPAASTPVPRDARIIRGRGRFLIPGLWDMHVHSDVPGGGALPPLHVVNGVTGVRDMGGGWEELTAMRADIRTGRLMGPRMILTGPYLEGNPQPIAHLRVRTPADAAPALDSLARLGVDFVKFHTGLSPESFYAAARAARERGMPFGGHIPRLVGAAAASDSGMKSIEHLLTIPTPCTPADSTALAPRFPVQAALGRCSSADPAPLHALLRRNGTWVVPTFTAQYEIALWPGRAVPGDSFGVYLPDTLRRYVASIFPMPDSIPPGADSVGRAVFERRLALVGTLHRAGVGILAGTDAPLRNSPPGFGLHAELGWLVASGLSAREALHAATLGAATFLGLQDSLGTIAPGMLADLVLLDADPTRSIANIRRIHAVIANGRLIDSAGRAAVLRGARGR